MHHNEHQACSHSSIVHQVHGNASPGVQALLNGGFLRSSIGARTGACLLCDAECYLQVQRVYTHTMSGLLSCMDAVAGGTDAFHCSTSFMTGQLCYHAQDASIFATVGLGRVRGHFDGGASAPSSLSPTSFFLVSHLSSGTSASSTCQVLRHSQQLQLLTMCAPARFASSQTWRLIRSPTCNSSFY